jgi:hypothetical protein
MTGEKIIAMAQKAVYEKRKGWRLIEERLAQLGYIGAPASQFSPVTEGMDMRASAKLGHSAPRERSAAAE